MPMAPVSSCRWAIVPEAPGLAYVFDTQEKKAQHVISQRDWFEPERTATVQPIALQARDGVPLHGDLSLPRTGTGKNLPMAVMPHGGPFEIFDSWHYGTEGHGFYTEPHRRAFYTQVLAFLARFLGGAKAS